MLSALCQIVYGKRPMEKGDAPSGLPDFARCHRDAAAAHGDPADHGVGRPSHVVESGGAEVPTRRPKTRLRCPDHPPGNDDRDRGGPGDPGPTQPPAAHPGHLGARAGDVAPTPRSDALGDREGLGDPGRGRVLGPGAVDAAGAEEGSLRPPGPASRHEDRETQASRGPLHRRDPHTGLPAGALVHLRRDPRRGEQAPVSGSRSRSARPAVRTGSSSAAGSSWSTAWRGGRSNASFRCCTSHGRDSRGRRSGWSIR